MNKEISRRETGGETDVNASNVAWTGDGVWSSERCLWRAAEPLSKGGLRWQERQRFHYR